MFDVNLTSLSTMNANQQIASIQSSFVTPELIFLFSCMFIISLMSGLILLKTHQSRAKYVGIWFISFIISGIILLSLIFLPSIYSSFFKWLGGLFI